MHPASSAAAAHAAVTRTPHRSIRLRACALATLGLTFAALASAATLPDLGSFASRARADRAVGPTLLDPSGTAPPLRSGNLADTERAAPFAPEAIVSPAAWSFESNVAFRHLGMTVATAGDVNGDGYSDAVALGESGSQTALYLFYGSETGLALAPGFPVTNLPGGNQGRSAYAAGDVNDDGYGDVAVGLAYSASGVLRVYYGSASGLQLTGYFEKTVIAPFADVVRPGGDINGDGFDDLLVGSPGMPPGFPCGSGSGPTGIVEVYYGSASGTTDTGRQIVLGCQWATANSGFGRAVSTAGDVNGDGFDDVLIGAQGGGVPPNGIYGNVWVAYGSASGLPVFASSANLVNLMAGSRLQGYNAGSFFGAAVATAGDVNGDGYADIAVGAPYEDTYAVDGGFAWVFAGGPAGVDTTQKLWWESSTVPGAQLGSRITPAGDHDGDGRPDLLVEQNGQVDVVTAYASGMYISQFLPYPSPFACETAGDVNGDGFADLIVGDYGYGNGESLEGRVLLHLGAGGLPATASSWQVTTNLLPDPGFGWSVASIGDVNGDGFDDMALGAPLWDDFSTGTPDNGLVLVYYGGINGPSTTYDWFYYGAPNDRAGLSVASAGDVNGDGYGDMIMGVQQYGSGNGKALVWYGRSTGLGFTPDRVLTGATFDSGFGSSVASAGDVNGDGYGDVVVGAPADEDLSLPTPLNDEGRAWLYLGGPGGLSVSPTWSDRGGQSGAHFGSTVASAGDVNGDGLSDVVVAAPDWDAPAGRFFIVDCGRLFVSLGQSSGTPLATQVIIDGLANSRLGGSVAGAGDVNGDGYSDIVAGAPSRTGALVAEGMAVVYPGSATGISSTALWSESGGEAYGNFGSSVASAGDVNGDGLGDILVGGVFQDLGGAQDRGHAAIYLGPLTAGTPAAWNAYGPSGFANMGHSVANAGDLDGDGWNELVFGMPGFTDVSFRQGLVRLYKGAGGAAVKQLAFAFRPLTGRIVQPLDLTDAHLLAIGGTGRSPAGRTRVRLEWRLRPANGLPVETLAGVGTYTKTGVPGAYGSLAGLTIGEPRLRDGIAYAWQLRSRSRSPYFPTSIWRSPSRSSAREWDLRAPGTSVDVPIASAELAILEPRPNPMQVSSVITFRLPREQAATLCVVDVQGRRVRELAKGTLAAGPHQARWDGLDPNGQRVAAGIYFVRLDCKDRSVTRRLAVVR